MTALLGKIRCFKVARGIGAANHRAKSPVAQQIIIYSLTPNFAGRSDGIVFIGIKQINVVSLLHIIQRKRFVCQELVKKPQPPGKLAGWFGPEIFKKICFCNFLKKAGEYRKIRTIILEGKFKMITQCFPRPVLGRIYFLDNVPTRIDPVDSTGPYQRPVPIRDDIEIVQLNKRRISCEPESRFILIVYRNGFLRKNDPKRDLSLFSRPSQVKQLQGRNLIRPSVQQEKQLYRQNIGYKRG